MLPLCPWCKKERVKLKKNKTCSLSCASAMRWANETKEGKKIIFHKANQYARRTAHAKRLQKEFESVCKELNIKPTEEIRKLYIRGRSKGYSFGWTASYKRRRKENE